MASYNKEERRNVIPNWRNYKDTVESGEYSGIYATPKYVPIISLAQYVATWNEEQSIAAASNLVSAGIANGQIDDSDVIKAAEHIRAHKDDCSEAALRISNAILGMPAQIPDSPKENNLRRIDKIINSDIIEKEKIRVFREQLANEYYNPIIYCEMARCYTNIGLNEKAKQMMLAALHIAPSHRYITRCAARMFLHITNTEKEGEEDIERLRNILSHNDYLKYDPWILSTEIAVNSALGKTSRHIKDGRLLISSNRYSAFALSELCSSIGTIEAENGAHKNSRKLFSQALINPNDNSLAQAEWIKTIDPLIQCNSDDYSQVAHKYEADSRRLLANDKYDEAFSAGIDWMNDMTFSKRAIGFSSNVAYTYLKDYESAIKLMKYGLKTRPNDLEFINNIAYSMALNNEIENASAMIESISKEMLSNSEPIFLICILATRGLIEFRKGNILEGESLYGNAMSLIKKYESLFNFPDSLSKKAALNLLRERLLSHVIDKTTAMNQLATINGTNDKELGQLKEDIINIINDKSS